MLLGYETAVLPTLSDTAAEPAGIADAIVMRAAGNVSITTPSGTTVAFTALPVGSIIPLKILRVNSTGTTASATALLYGPRV